MRALAAAKLPVEIGVVFFRDPTARVAVIMKLSFRMLGRAGVELAAAADALTEADFVPRKSLAEIIVTGDAYSAEATAVIPVQIAMGGKLQVRAEVRTPNGVPATRAPLVGFGAIAPRFSLAAPTSGKEASFSDAWVEAHRDGFQVAPPDQRTPEPLGAATPLSFFNLSQGGGIMGLTLPRVAPFALLVEGEGKGNAHRVAMRCDTVHLDTSGAALHLSFRGEVELDRFATLPDLVVGLLSGQQVPRAADIQVAFGAGVELPLRRLNRERVTEAAEARSKLNETQRFTAPSTIDDEPTVDPRGTVPLIDRAMLSGLPRPAATLTGDEDDHPTLPPAAPDELEVTMTPDSVDDEYPTIPPPPAGRPRLPPIHIDSETTSLLELPVRPKIDEERTGLIQLPLRAIPQKQALPFVATAAPATGRPPPPNDDAIPFGRIDAPEESTGMGRHTLLEGSMPATALPFAVASPRTPPAPRPSGRGGTPWEKPASTLPPPDMGPERNGGTLPPPPPVDEPAIARSFGLGTGAIASAALPSLASSVWRDAPTRATTLDAATIARVVTSLDVNAAIIGLERSRIDFALGLEEWANLLDSDADKRDFARLSELLSALHVEALIIR